MFENPRRGRQARNFGKNVPKILDLKSSSEQIFSENCRWVPLLIPSSERQNLPTRRKNLHQEPIKFDGLLPALTVLDTPIYSKTEMSYISYNLRIIQEYFQPKIGRKIRIFSLGRGNNILI